MRGRGCRNERQQMLAKRTKREKCESEGRVDERDGSEQADVGKKERLLSYSLP